MQVTQEPAKRERFTINSIFTIAN